MDAGAAAASEPFRWAVGIEDTFIPQVRSRTGRVLDEYALTGHYGAWREDLALVAETGVRTMRYGIPWYRVNPSPGAFDWRWTDDVLEHMVSDLGITPIIDLVHYGCPLWLEREFVNPDYPQRVADYAAAFAERYRDLVSWYTPLNEPRINARLCGQNGTWPPYLRGERGYVRVMLALARGMSLTVAAVRSAQPAATIVVVDATEHLVTEDPELTDEVALQLEQQYLATDLVLGRVEDGHPLMPWLAANGAPTGELDWLRANRQQIDVLGINYYPEFSHKTVSRKDGRIRRRRGGGWTAELEAIIRHWHRRYDRPAMVTEISTGAPVDARRRWLDASARAVLALRDAGTPVIGYTWWPLFSLVAWSYRGGRKPMAQYIVHMGLWDLQPGPDGRLLRVRTPVADRFTEIVATGTAAAPTPAAL
ncbi:MAG TPA: family 1 glycosylhydrolase [Candidatus Limnocylindria bacterium]|nr:family 1 glycosylhydrolase [Candidatus Limnocylindria bacterium]